MSNKMFFNPLGELASFQREVDQFLTSLTRPAVESRGATPTINLGQDGDHLFVEAVVPGYDPASLEVSIEDNVLRLSSKQPGAPENVKRWMLNERNGGKFTHRLRLPVEVDRDRISAEYKNGILLITLPKAQTAKPKQIEVKVSQ